MEIANYTLRTVYSFFICIVLCVDLTALAISATMTRIHFSTLMMVATVLIDSVFMFLSVMPILRTVFVCEMTVFPLYFLCTLFFVFFPALLLSMTNMVHEFSRGKSP